MRTTPSSVFLPLIAAAHLSLGAGWAHEIPSDATVRLLARPSGEAFQLLVRAPLSSMRDHEFPLLPAGYLDLETLEAQLPDLATVWIASFVEIYEDGRRLGEPRVAATQVSILADRSYSSVDQALAHLREPPPANEENLVLEQVHFDVLLEYAIRSADSRFAIRPRLEHLAAQVLTTITFETPEGAIRAYQLRGDQGRVPLDPSWSQAAWRFVQLGFAHILDGPDHLLFLLCLVIPFRELRPLVWIVTAFTIAHSITLVSAAAGLAPQALWFPPLVETLIAATVLYMALENIVGAGSSRRRWMFAFGFGLIHGFGFAFALRETLQFAGAQVASSLFAFNIGVELGQLLVIILLIPALDALFRFAVEERLGTILLSALVAHTGWHWMTERWEVLSRYQIGWDEAAPLLWTLAWVAVVVLALWAAARWGRRQARAIR